jgi:hypothetical protein
LANTSSSLLSETLILLTDITLEICGFKREEGGVTFSNNECNSFSKSKNLLNQV